MHQDLKIMAEVYHYQATHMVLCSMSAVKHRPAVFFTAYSISSYISCRQEPETAPTPSISNESAYP